VTVLGLISAAICISIALNATVLRPNMPSRLFAALAALTAIWYAVAYFRQRLVADNQGIRVRNLMSTFTLRWGDIDHFEAPPLRSNRGAIGRHYGLRIITHDRRIMHVSLWGATALDQPGFADHVVVELERLRVLHT
jgi:Bacterial PH domain